VKWKAMMFANFAWCAVLSGVMFPLTLRYCQVSESVISEFDEGVLADMRKPLVPIIEGCHLRFECFCKESCSVGSRSWNPPAEAVDYGAVNPEIAIGNGASCVVENCPVAS
jgi:hypothetical protein